MTGRWIGGRARGRSVGLVAVVTLGLLIAAPVGAGVDLPHPVLFVTQMPIPADFATIGSVFANHRADLQSVGRGGDLYIRYEDGALRNLTAEAGYGESGFQGANAIAVRDPTVHWSGTRAVFSMVIGAPEEQFDYETYYWQLYEVSGFGVGETVSISRVPNQPAANNNIYPFYAEDGRILFVSDRARDGSGHLYPNLDEYESTPTNSGLWSLDPASGELRLLDHAPSGDFDPFVDSFGRILFTRWDHLQRDQQADADAVGGGSYGTFNWSGEGPGAVPLDTREEVFPEPRPQRTDLLDGTNLEGHRFNHFLPWQLELDGTGLEILNHLGRHELHSYFNRSINDDGNVVEFIASASGRTNPNSIGNLLQLAEDPTSAGRYFGTDAPEFQTHASGMIVSLDAPPTLRPDLTTVTYVTHPDTATVVPDGDPVPPTHSGHYREPIALDDGTLIAVHTPEARRAANEGSRPFPVPRYDFRLKVVDRSGTYGTAAAPLTGGITKTLSYWDPDVLVQYSGELWELNPVEVRPRTVPPSPSFELPAPEQAIFDQEGVDVASFRTGMAADGLALVVVRNATTRDALDRQQPFNLRVPGGEETLGAAGTVYDVAHLQFFQGDLIRGMGGIASPDPGRRVLAQPMHGVDANPPNPTGPEGSVAVALDGSIAALVPAERALAWQLTDSSGVPVVRERNWLTFQAGEIRVCDGCHGVNDVNQAGEPPASNSPEALRSLLQQVSFDTIFADGFESGDTSAWPTTRP